MQFESFDWLSHHGICIGNRMNASAFWDLWSQMMF